MALLALTFVAALAGDRFPWAHAMRMTRAEVNGMAAQWGSAEVAESPAAAVRRYRSAHGAREVLVIPSSDGVLAFRAGGLEKPGPELLEAIKKNGGALAVRIADRTGAPVAAQAVWLADTACALRVAVRPLCIPSEIDAALRIAGAAMPAADVEVVRFEPAGGGARVSRYLLPKASPAALFSLARGGGAELCAKVAFPAPRPDACPLVMALQDGGGARSVALLRYGGGVALAHAARALEAAGWRAAGAESSGMLRYRQGARVLDVSRVERAGETYLVYLGRSAP